MPRIHLALSKGKLHRTSQQSASFWSGPYFDVRKDLRGRYPKHYWPENPLEAEPTHRAKPRKR